MPSTMSTSHSLNENILVTAKKKREIQYQETNSYRTENIENHGQFKPS